MRHQFIFYIEPEALQNELITFNSQESHQISQVLRLKTGAEILAVDGCGRQYTARLKSPKVGLCTGEVVKAEKTESSPPLPIHLGLHCLKGDHWEIALEAACELGVLSVWLTDYAGSSLRWTRSRRDRAERKALEALKQSGGSFRSMIQGPGSLADLLARHPNDPILVADPDGLPISQLPKLITPIVLLIGSEAGLPDEENRILDAVKPMKLSLGKRRLRTEIASITALSQLAGVLTTTNPIQGG